MTLSLDQILPQARTGLDKVGFLFGCGTSKDAGYPLTAELTTNVINALRSEQKTYLEEILIKEGVEHDFTTGQPDIEIINDLIVRRRVESPGEEIIALEQHIIDTLVENLVSVDNPLLDDHVEFLRIINHRASSSSSPIWIFTTNYDVLFELAATIAQIPVINGFEGVFNRYFNQDVYDYRSGRVTESRFIPRRCVNLRLIKLHGSISWYRQDQSIVECDPRCVASEASRSMILPRRKKIVDSLEHPYDKLFAYASRTIGSQCKYLVSCGFGFRDQHINDHLILPKLRDGAISLFALYGGTPTDLDQLSCHNAFSYATPNQMKMRGQITNEGTDLWQFKKLVELLSR